MTAGTLGFTAASLVDLTRCRREVADLVFSRLQPPALAYRRLSEEEKARIVAGIETTIRDRPLRVVGADDPAVWEKGWGEVADQLLKQPISFESLRPQYFVADAPCRLFGELVQPLSPDFEYWVGLCVRSATFAQHLADWREVCEFGCGTGINLLLLRALSAHARLVGCDWAVASQKILQQMARETGSAIEGRRFNMLTGAGDDGSVGLDTAVLTVHALEQLGVGWRPFLDHLRARRPGLCVHIEPLLELYDPADPLADLARRYHLKRGYLQGFVPEVQALAASGEAEIIALRRTAFAGLYHEAFSLLVWRWR